MITIKYDVPIQVGFGTFVFLRKQFPGIIATQVIDGNYYVKVWLMNYAKEIAKYIEPFPDHNTTTSLP